MSNLARSSAVSSWSQGRVRSFPCSSFQRVIFPENLLDLRGRLSRLLGLRVRKDQIRPGGNDGSDDADADAFLEFIEPVLEAGECLQAVGAAVGEVGAGAVSLDEAQVPQTQTGSNIVVQIV